MNSIQLKKVMLSVLVMFLFFSLTVKVNANESKGSSILVNNSINFREKFGLNSNEQYIKDMEQKSLISKRFGVLLSPEEESELVLRIESQEKSLPNILQYLDERHKKNFGIIYIDQSQKGILFIGFKDTSLITQNDMQQMTQLYDKNDVIIFNTNSTEEDLNELHKLLLNDIGYFREKLVEIIDITTNVVNQTVEVGVLNLDPYSELIINQRYKDPRIVLVKSEMSVPDSRTSTYSTLQAGIRITKDGGGGCTLGFTAKSGLAHPAHYVITAAHCGSTGDTFKQGTNSLGTVIKRVFSSGVDAMAIGQNPDLTYSNEVYTSSSYGSYFSSTQSRSNLVVGQSVSMSGSYSNTVNTGVIISKNTSVTYSGLGTLSNMVEADYNRVGGDSGAPVYSSNMLMGIHSGKKSNGNAVFSHIQTTLTALNNNGTCSDCFLPILD